MVYQSSHPRDKRAQIYPSTPELSYGEIVTLPFPASIHPASISSFHTRDPVPLCAHRLLGVAPPPPPLLAVLARTKPTQIFTQPSAPAMQAPSHAISASKGARTPWIFGRAASVSKKVGMDAFPEMSKMREYETACRGKRHV